MQQETSTWTAVPEGSTALWFYGSLIVVRRYGSIIVVRRYVPFSEVCCSRPFYPMLALCFPMRPSRGRPSGLVSNLVHLLVRKS